MILYRNEGRSVVPVSELLDQWILSERKLANCELDRWRFLGQVFGDLLDTPYTEDDPRAARHLAGVLESISAPDDVSGSLVASLREFLVHRWPELCAVSKVVFQYDNGCTIQANLHELLTQACVVKKEGPVAHYLVGAQLQLRFPATCIKNTKYIAPEGRYGEMGDYLMGNTVFHVCMAPRLSYIAAVLQSVRQDQAAYLLVPDNKLAVMRGILEMEHLGDCVAAEAIDSFIGLSLGLLSEFDTDSCERTFAELLAEYNRRVLEVETDGSLLIEIPGAIGGDKG